MTLTYEDLLLQLYYHTPTAFSRFGDGEFACIFGMPGANVDGHCYFPDLGYYLQNILVENPAYFIGIQRLAREKYGPFLFFQQLTHPYSTDADLLHRASIRGDLERLFAVLRSRMVYVVGPAYLKFVKHFPFELIPIPEKNCWTEHDSVLSTLRQLHYPDAVFVFCASMMSKWLIHQLWTVDPQGTYLDFGSLLDPYAGKCTRTYHKKLNLFPSVVSAHL